MLRKYSMFDPHLHYTSEVNGVIMPLKDINDIIIWPVIYTEIKQTKICKCTRQLVLGKGNVVIAFCHASTTKQYCLLLLRVLLYYELTEIYCIFEVLLNSITFIFLF